MYVHFAEAFHWTPEQVDATDAAIVDELLAYLRAKSDHAEQQKARRERDERRRRTQGKNR